MIEPAGMSDAELIDMLASLQTEKRKLQAKLDLGISDRNQLVNRKLALLHRASEYDLVKAEIRKRTTAYQASMPAVFMRIAKQRLDAETYQEILDEAKQEGV